VAVTAEQVRNLREKTGAGMMDCKRALEATGGDEEKAIAHLREEGLAAAARREGRATSEGLVAAYVHAGGKIGVLVEVNCETDFVAKTEDFQALAKNLAMQVAATNPRWLSREEVPEEILAQEREIYRAQAAKEGKPEKVLDKIVEGRLNKYFQEFCLVDQPFVRDPDQKVADMVREVAAKLGENVSVRRFVRFQLGH
jgi:elongation factor Ts